MRGTELATGRGCSEQAASPSRDDGGFDRDEASKPTGQAGSASRSSGQAYNGSTRLSENILFGGLAGVTGTTLIFPFYTIKTRLMTAGGHSMQHVPDQLVVPASKGDKVAASRLSASAAFGGTHAVPSQHLLPSAAGHASATATTSENLCTGSRLENLSTQKLTSVASSPTSPASAMSGTTNASAANSAQAMARAEHAHETKTPAHSAQRPRILDAFRHIVRTQGVRGLYRGLTPTLLGVAPEKAIKLAANDFLSPNLESIHRILGMMAGAGAGLCQVVATNPMEVLMITMQTRSAAGKHGLVLLGRCTRSASAAYIPFSMVFFGLNTSLKEHLAPRYQGALPIGAVFGIGILAGATAAALSTPLDVVKTRIQSGLCDQHGQPYHTVISTLDRVVRHEGVRALWSGALPRMLIVGPLFGITLLFYEVQQRLARATHQQHGLAPAAVLGAPLKSTSSLSATRPRVITTDNEQAGVSTSFYGDHECPLDREDSSEAHRQANDWYS
ncbi:hypothetical protein F1559_002646 [Cyanidiococcus yangmingshanensis]|uniref:Uncharacterized protein n=1 Tax=Cyanidiococcus yangmingshanensis TaxID=2690220 RepID=A0A7J7IJ12_9RHOD|nr:hypothetical protein F1559_002646 [Cyanidiococcus yangmingshanensis]